MGKTDLEARVPKSCRDLLDKNNTELRSAIPELARDWERMVDIESTVADLPSSHQFYNSDSRHLLEKSGEDAEPVIKDESIHLIITSPPYFNIKEYNESGGQLGSIQEYDHFLEELTQIWKNCYSKLIPGGRMCVVTGDILQSRRENGRHRVLPLHAEIQKQCTQIGFDCLAPVIWAKIGNASLEAGGNARFLGKPYEPGAVIKNDIEYILMFRKPGRYRSPTVAERILSTLQVDNHKRYFQQIWTGVDGSKIQDHPAPYPRELVERLIRMFSFVGDRVLDPFAGIGTTAVAASRTARDSVSIEIDAEYIRIAKKRLESANPDRVGREARLSDF